MNQRQEIETIKKRTIALNLSEADCERLSNLAGRHGLTVSALLENFIGDLVDGTYSNGSDERMYAEQWFERCWFAGNPSASLVGFLINGHYDVEDFLKTMNALEEYGEQYPDDLKEWREDVEKIIGEYKSQCDHEPNMEEELEALKAWYNESLELKG